MCFLLGNALMRRRPATQAFVDNDGGDDDDLGDGDKEGDEDDQHSNKETNGNAGLRWLRHRFLLLILRIIKHLVTIPLPTFRLDKIGRQIYRKENCYLMKPDNIKSLKMKIMTKF